MTSSPETTIQFIDQCSFSEISPWDKFVRFTRGRLELTRAQLRLSWVSEFSIDLREIKSDFPYPADANRSNQLQLEYKKSVLVVHLLGGNQRNDDIRTEQLFNMLIGDGVPVGRSELFYFAGMDLTKQPTSNGERGNFSTATGVFIGEIIWESIKTAGSFLISSFKPF